MNKPSVYKPSAGVLAATPLLLAAAGLLCGFNSGASAAEACETVPGPDQTQIEAFVNGECYKAWAETEPSIYLSGVTIDGVNYARHQYLQVYYSPEVSAWLEGGRKDKLPDGSMIVALEYAEGGDSPGTPQRVLTKLKHRAGAFDGWFWSTTSFSDPAASDGRFGAPSCLGCHGSADNPELTFLAPGGPVSDDKWKPARDLKWKEPPKVTRQLPKPLAEADQGFLDYFNIPDVPSSEVVPFPGKEHDHVVAGKYAGPGRDQPQIFLTSNQCMGCHNASQLLSNTTPRMWYPNPGSDDPNDPHRNYSPFGEWSASMNGLAGRDPVWHAQVETERILRPHLANYTDHTCFTCHGPMAGRQLAIDTGDPAAQFTIDMFYAKPGDPHAKYGSLARDGVSCTVCHNVLPDDLGVDPDFLPGFPRLHIPPEGLFTYTAQFRTKDNGVLWGPYPDKNLNGVHVMDRTIGMSAKYGEHMGEARLCGSCHIVLVPALPVGYEGTDPNHDEHLEIAFEQTTYWEWRNSIYQNERDPTGDLPAPCQVCHMHPHKRHPIANYESGDFPNAQGREDRKTLRVKDQNPFWRHTLMGINLPVFNMYMQFPDIVGAQLPDPSVPEETLNPMLTTADWMADFARDKAIHLDILSTDEVDGHLLAVLQVNSLAGHKVPTGAGFRRAFVRFRVLDDSGKVLWVSGETSPYGVILDGDGKPLESESTLVPEKSQPHYQEITRQDQVQIYEVRALDSENVLQTTVLGIFEEYKDNRLLPMGWDPDEEAPNIYAMRPRLPSIHGRLNPDNIILNEQGRPIGRKNDNCHDGYDPDYCDKDLARLGRDRYVYKIPLAEIPGWARVEAQMFYQTIPPYFLADKFRQGKKDGEYLRDMKRLIHIASRLNFKDSTVENWRVVLGKPTAMNKGEAARPGLSYEEAKDLVKAPSY